MYVSIKEEVTRWHSTWYAFFHFFLFFLPFNILSLVPIGHPSWGIAWYINDQLIPEIYVERGKTYTFLVEGGDDRTNPAK